MYILDDLYKVCKNCKEEKKIMLKINKNNTMEFLIPMVQGHYIEDSIWYSEVLNKLEDKETNFVGITNYGFIDELERECLDYKECWVDSLYNSPMDNLCGCELKFANDIFDVLNDNKNIYEILSIKETENYIIIELKDNKNDKNIKLNENKLKKDLNFKNFTFDDLYYLIEFSYIIGKFNDNQYIKKLDNMIKSCDDGIEVYSLFIKYLYDKFINNGGDYVSYIEYNLEEIVTDFLNYYFE